MPTKGLTLPLVSYGGSSLIIMSVTVAVLLRIDFELRVAGVQALDKGRKREGKAKVKAAMKPLQANDQDLSQEPDDE